MIFSLVGVRESFQKKLFVVVFVFFVSLIIEIWSWNPFKLCRCIMRSRT